MTKYWCITIVALCTAIAVAYLPPPERTASRYYQNPVIRADSFLLVPRDNDAVWLTYTEYVLAGEQLRQGRVYARILERGDSIRRSLESGLIREPGTHFTFGPQVPEALRQVVRSRTRGLSTGPDHAGGRYAVVVAVVLDTVLDREDDPWIPHMPRYAYLLPQRADEPCVSLVSIDRHRASAGLVSGRVLPRMVLGADPTELLGPCAFYSQFGMPGAGIEDWLQGAEYLTALRADWLAPSQFQHQAPRHRIWAGYSAHPVFVSCASGRAAACLAAPTSRPRMVRVIPDAGRPGAVVVARDSHWYWSMPLGARTRNFLSDMVMDLGPEQFQEFWGSEERVETAFFRAAGVSLEDWTMRWARREIGVPRRGPAPVHNSTALSLALGVVLLGGCAAYSSRRQVG